MVTEHLLLDLSGLRDTPVLRFGTFEPYVPLRGEIRRKPRPKGQLQLRGN